MTEADVSEAGTRTVTGPRSDQRELVTARVAGRTTIVLAVVCTATAWVLVSRAAALTALATSLAVGAVYAGSAWLQARASRRSFGAAMGVAVGGLSARLALYAAALPVLLDESSSDPGTYELLPAIHGPTLVVTATVAIVVTLAAEWWTAWTHPELWWLSLDDTDGTRPTARSRD